MAFTAAQKQQMRNYLGAPAVYVDLQEMLEGAFDAVGANAEAVTHVTAWLSELAIIDANMVVTSGGGGSSATYGALKKVDEVEFYGPSESGSLATNTIGAVARGRSLIQRIAVILGVAHEQGGPFPATDYFTGRPSNSSALALG